MTGFSEFNYFSRFFEKNAEIILSESKRQIGVYYIVLSSFNSADIK